MLTFTPPSGFKNITEYKFSDGQRLVVIRSTHELGSDADLLSVANDYANQTREYLNSDSAVVSPLQKRADGSSYVTVEVTFAKQGAIERSGFLLLRNGTSVHVSLRSDRDDAGAGAEFLRLIQTVQAAPPTEGKALSLAAQGQHQVTYRAGPALVNLSPDYRNNTVFKFRNEAGTTLTLSHTQTPESTAPSAEPKGVLGRRINRVDGRGTPFSYEMGEDPWAARSAKAAAMHFASRETPVTEKTRELAPGLAVTVRVHGPASSIPPTDLVDQVLQSVKLEVTPSHQ